ncbi:hypothetical protein tloyanaT_24130 [Thalassotalea loyana]|uniref:PDZ domain-containing protein n=1 Tax=Thalassotalea loyana TaxID=280483 RepID=A0ABQ6HDG2_9GAMM|nr:trypsin-like peptidase domain-containing protein [Thalassotalea loyana]GLX86160.1 hypothetical protein tloyanaT_24130 [Thalassotalea loyana]
MNSWQKFGVMTLVATVALMSLTACSPKNSEERWNKTVNNVSSGVVSIQTDVPLSFDGRWNRSSYATGFVVDATQGIILTNRHVITPGPVTAKAILVNNEEIDLTPLYFDPIHDFGFFKYDPAQIKHLQPHEFILSDKTPEIGESIRIIGNDAGQKISILDGTISRLDRDAPQYGKGNYNDFNIYYIQAATSSSGGSSGAPVVNIKGEAVALNAGSQTKSANAFYLPLSPIKEALLKLQQGKEINRGTLKTTFNSTPYAELQRLGLSDDLEKKYRDKYPSLKGLLVARNIIPQSSADSQLQVGDILLEINDQDAVNFTQLASALNQHVGQVIKINVIRRGQAMSLNVQVDDLHDLSPQTIVKFDGSIFHTLSYQQARHFNKPIEGVYVANSGGSFKKAGVPDKSVITEFNGQKITHVDQLNAAFQEIDNGTKVHLRYFDFSTPRSTNYSLVEINRKWFEHSRCEKTATLPYWPCQKYQDENRDAVATDTNNGQLAIVDSKRLEDTLVRVSFSSPYSIQGRSGDKNHYGTGVIVDIEKGWVVVAQSVAFSKLGDVKLTFNNRFEIDAKVEYIHPLHNLTLLSYQPSDLPNVQVSQAVLSDKPMEKGETIVQMGLNYDGVVEYRETQVDTTEEFWLRDYNVPQFIDKNIQATHFVNPNPEIDGIIVNSDYQVAGLWFVFDAADASGKNQSSSIAGLSVHYVKEMIEHMNLQTPIYSLDISMTMIPPVDALQMGLPDQWLTRLQETNPKNKVLAIYNVSTSSNSAEFLKRGDILLAINDTPVSTFKQVEKLSQAPSVDVTYFSQGQIKTSSIATQALYGTDIDQVLFWSGLYLHAPHRAAQLQGNVSSEGVYVASYQYGSPATRYGVFAMQRIVEIDGEKISTTQDFIQAVKGKKHQESVLIKTIDFNNNPKVTTLKVNNHYWPFYELRYENGQWIKIDHSVAL